MTYHILLHGPSWRTNIEKYLKLCTRNATSPLSSTTPRCPTHPKSPTKQKGSHNFLYPRERWQKNVPVTIIDPLVNTSLTEITVIFYSFFNILRPSRKPFCEVTLYCKAPVSVELFDIISLVLKYIYVYPLILNILLEITSKHICPYHF